MVPGELVARAEGAAIATDHANRILEWNEAADELLHLRSRGAQRGDNFYKTIEARDPFGNRLRSGETSFLAMTQRGEPAQGFELVADDGNGTRRKLAVLPVVLLAGRRRDSAVVYFLRPILRRRRADEAIEQVLSMSPSARLEPETMRQRPADGRRCPLTERQLEVLALMADGASVEELAEKLGVTGNTVKSHISHLLQRLGVHSRVQAVSLALRERWI